eukprot:10782596-Prorocentrum_lima.AAC.1
MSSKSAAPWFRQCCLIFLSIKHTTRSPERRATTSNPGWAVHDEQVGPLGYFKDILQHLHVHGQRSCV